MKKIMTNIRNKIELGMIRLQHCVSEHKYVSGITVIELTLILVIIIALLLIFKSQLIDLINSIFKKITSESSGI